MFGYFKGICLIGRVQTTIPAIDQLNSLQMDTRIGANAPEPPPFTASGVLETRTRRNTVDNLPPPNLPATSEPQGASISSMFAEPLLQRPTEPPPPDPLQTSAPPPWAGSEPSQWEQDAYQPPSPPAAQEDVISKKNRRRSANRERVCRLGTSLWANRERAYELCSDQATLEWCRVQTDSDVTRTFDVAIQSQVLTSSQTDPYGRNDPYSTREPYPTADSTPSHNVYTNSDPDMYNPSDPYGTPRYPGD
eukprot:gene11920-14078_t